MGTVCTLDCFASGFGMVVRMPSFDDAAIFATLTPSGSANERRNASYVHPMRCQMSFFFHLLSLLAVITVGMSSVAEQKVHQMTRVIDEEWVIEKVKHLCCIVVSGYKHSRKVVLKLS